MDVSNVCRSCMNEVSSCEQENFNAKTVEMFCFCTNIKISDKDKLPQQFCNECITNIELAFNFVTKARKANVTLRNIISRAITKIIVKPVAKNVPDNTDNNIRVTQPDYRDNTSDDNYTEYEEIYKLELPESYLKKESHIDNILPDNKLNTSTDNTIGDYTEPTTEEIEKFEDQESTQILENVNSNKNQQSNAREVDESKKNIVCPLCSKMFRSKIWYDKHMKKEHSSNEYLCTHCTRTFTKKSELIQHAKSHSDERQFPCTAENCSKTFKRQTQLAAHARLHADARPYECDLCSMRFKQKGVLKLHLKVHKNTKEYLCYQCGAGFNQGSNLKTHMRTHTGERPFACPRAACSFRAAVLSNLNRHLRMHGRVNSHVCDICTKGFYDAGALTRHVRTHTGELPYACPQCARAFSDSWKRKSHLMRAHRLALADIPRMRKDGRPVI